MFDLKPQLKLLAICAGYVVAVTVATIVTVALILLPTALPDNGALGSIYASANELPGMLLIGFTWTFPCALPGFVVAIVWGERNDWSSWRSYALAGMANAAPSLAIFSATFGSPFEIPSMVVASFPGGLAGGAAYWFSVGRMVARARTLAPAEAA